MASHPPDPTEDELRAAYEEEIKRLRIEHVLLDNVVTLVNLGMRRTGLAPGTEGERDADQVRLAIESVRALLPVIEEIAPDQVAPIKQALSQLQLGFVRIGGQAPEPNAGASGSGPAGSGSGQPPSTGQPAPGATSPGADATDEKPVKPGEPGPAQRSGRLWVPGQ